MNQKLVDFAIKQAGGEDAVLKAYYRNELEAQLKKAKTFQDIVDLAQSNDEWSDAIWGLTRHELAALLGGRGSSTMSLSGEPKARRARMTKQAVMELRQQILTVLSKEPAGSTMSVSEIADALDGDVDARTVAIQIKPLRVAGEVGMKGERWSAGYYLERQA